MKVTAVIVSFNRLSLLQQCISSLNKGAIVPDQIIVVDNASSDGSKEWLQNNSEITAYCLNQNRGGSYAFTYGIEQAIEHRADWIWTMDEDVKIDSNCLKNMLHLAEQQLDVDYWCPAVLTPNEEINPNSLPEVNTNLNVTTSTFIGTLQRASCVKRYGLPISNMFRFYDDIEFYWRIGQLGAIGKTASNSHLIHLSTGKSELDYLMELHRDQWAPLYFRNQYYFLGLKNGKRHLYKKVLGDIKQATKLNKLLINNTLKLTLAYFKSLRFKPHYGTK